MTVPSPAAPPVLVIQPSDAATPDWVAALPPSAAVLGASLPGDAAARLRGAACALIDGAGTEPLRLAQRVHAIDPQVQLVLVAPPGHAGNFQRAMHFTPGIGELWVVEPSQVNAELLGRAGHVTAQRRNYQTTRARLSSALADSSPHLVARAFASDAHLAALLQVLPDPVISVDEEGRVLSWNPSSERLLGYSEREVLGRNVTTLVAPEDAAVLRQRLDAANADRPVQGGNLAAPVRFRAKSGARGIGEATVTYFEAAGRRIRVLVLHDVTEQLATQDALESQASELEAQAAEMEAINEELQRRTTELERALSARSRFYAAMSHELRTPINAILGYNDLLLSGIYGTLSDAQSHALARAQRAARHLIELVNDVLDLAKIEAGRIELEIVKVIFPSLLVELLDTVRPLAEERGATLTLEEGAGEHAILSDPRRMRQILLNLISNAIKYGEGQPVTITWARTPDDGARVDVIDRGAGISPEDLPRIFEEFERGDAQHETGTGLGLPISRRLAEALGGRIEAKSTPGVGSTFSLVLPAALRVRSGHR